MLTPHSANFWFLSLMAICLGCQPSPGARVLQEPVAPIATRPPPSTSEPTRWIEDDAPRAFELAQSRSQPLFVDLWAPWCHTCLSMREQVLSSEAVPELGNLVLLSVDTEREQNERFLRAYPVGVWPTFYLLDPQTKSVLGRWLGAASPAQLSAWLQESIGTVAGPASLVREADALAADRSFAEAEAHYRSALDSAPANWSRRADTLVSLVASLLKQRKYAECLELVRSQAASLPPSVSAVDFAASGLSCAEHAPGNAPVIAVRQLLETTLARDCQTAAPGVSADDQADACGNLRRARESLGDKAGASRAAEQALRVIAVASLDAPPEAQLIYDWERTSSLFYLGRTAEAISLLLERERALPSSYNPPHYLARLYRDTGQWALGLAAIERALSKAYGPRRVGLMSIKADLLKGAGRQQEACAVLDQQLIGYRELPAGQRNPDAEAAVEQRRVDCAGSADAASRNVR